MPGGLSYSEGFDDFSTSPTAANLETVCRDKPEGSYAAVVTSLVFEHFYDALCFDPWHPQCRDDIGVFNGELDERVNHLLLIELIAAEIG